MHLSLGQCRPWKLGHAKPHQGRRRRHRAYAAAAPHRSPAAGGRRCSRTPCRRRPPQAAGCRRQGAACRCRERPCRRRCRRRLCPCSWWCLLPGHSTAECSGRSVGCTDLRRERSVEAAGSLTRPRHAHAFRRTRARCHWSAATSDRVKGVRNGVAGGGTRVS